MKRKYFLTAITACAMMLLLAAPLRAEDDGEEGTIEAEATLGAQTYADRDNPDSAKLEEYREVPNGVLLEHFMLNWKPRDRWFLEIEARDAAQADQNGALSLGMDKLWRAYFTWQENPRRFMDGAVSLYGMSGGVFTLSDTIQQCIEGAGQPAGAGGSSTVAGICGDNDGVWDAGEGTKAYFLKQAAVAAAPVDVRYQRSTGNAGFEATPNKNWLFRLDAQRESRIGNMPQSIVFGSSPGGNSGEAAAPVDFRTDTLTGNVEYVHDRFSVGANLMLSDFSNEYPTLVFDNPLRLTDSTSAGSSRARLTTYPDNTYQQFRLHGSANLPFWSTRLYAAASFAETEQDEAFLPLTINTAWSAAPPRDFNGDLVVDVLDDPALTSALPRANLGGEYETNTFEFRATARPADWLRVKGWWRSYERDDRSGDFLLTEGYVGGDTGLSGTCAAAAAALGVAGWSGVCTVSGDVIQRARLPYDYEKKSWGVEGRFGHFGPAAFGASFEREDVERQHAGAEESQEDTLKLIADLDAAKWLFLRATWKNQKREAHEYHAHYYEEAFPVGEAYVAAFNEGSRRPYWADRDRDTYSLLVDVSPGEKVSFYGEAGYAKNKYLDPEHGAVGGSFLDNASPYCEGLADDPTRILAGCVDADLNGSLESENILLAGKTFDKSTSYTLGVAFAPSARFDVYADYTWETFKYAMISRYRNIVSSSYGTDDIRDDWGSDMKDKYQTWGFGFNSEPVKDKTRLYGSASYSRGVEKAKHWYAAGGATGGNGLDPSGNPLLAYPDVKNSFTTAMLTLDHSVRKNLAFGFRWWYEKWKDGNWAVDEISAYMGDDFIAGTDNGFRTSFYLGGNFEDYEVHIAQFFVRVRM